MQKMFGTYYATAAGRMFASGLMGGQSEAWGRYQGLQRFVRVYGAVYGNSGYRCPLDQTPKGQDADHTDQEQAQRDREWMKRAMQSLDMSGCYPYMEQLISISTVDAGPAWLDRMIDVQQWNLNLDNLNRQLRAQAKEAGREYVALTTKLVDRRDQMIADAAIKALDILAPPVRDVGVVVERWENAA